MSKNLSKLSGRKGLENNLFARMGEMSRESGTASVEALSQLADEFLMGKASLYGTLTFYDFMKPGNKGKKAYICNGSACLCAGTQDAVRREIEKHLDASEIGHMTCLGRCHENGAFHFDGHNYSAKTPEEIAMILKGEGKWSDRYNVGAIGTPVLTRDFEGVKSYYAALPGILASGSEKVLEEIKKSKIRGRGGAGFPMGFKLEACRKEKSDIKFIICNADEGDPGAYSDRYLLEMQPHSVLFGMMTAGFAAGASYGILYIRAEYPESITAVEQAIDELRAEGLLGKKILGTDFDFEFKIIRAQGAYICGEETALINSIEGQRPEVRVRPPYPTTAGLYQKPTVVNNVETLAALHFILSEGGENYARLGTDKSSGTKLISLDSAFNRPGIYEVEMGTPLRQVFDELGRGYRKSIKAFHIGGPLGGLVPADKVDELTLDFESFAAHGFLLGHASVVSIPLDFPLIDYLAHLFDFASYESCGKCFPCRLGTKRGHEMMLKARNEEYKINRELLEDLLETLRAGSLCAHGGGIPLPVMNALKYFENELNPYFETQTTAS